MKRTIALLLAVAAVPALAAPAVAQEERVATFKFHAEAGSFPVDGREAYWSTPAYEVRIYEREVNVLRIDEDTVSNADYVAIELTAPGNVPLEVGTYTDVRMRSTASNPGLMVVSRGLACAPVYGTFTVNSIERDPVTGRLTDVDVEVEQRCGAPDAPAFSAHATLSS
ncbi:hypothetical protein ALI22I_19265 [Saccharothrix sp. ALI-22-I]|uniref:hypothetical protein n=1 Tax=Saccharothrix sp. ALI-22-I TaxID=1933778 RepID=UPI00097C72EE|nr:hypothetical protein [Saccharothrix sp. ALI-22-I]ONI88493.1 hypothetical protein ALI22I_19265 [Saccharothrix sp. ALI-22-I]